LSTSAIGESLLTSTAIHSGEGHANPVDADLIAFLYTVDVILFGRLPRLRRNFRSIYQFEEVKTEALTEAQSKNLTSYEAFAWTPGSIRVQPTPNRRQLFLPPCS
jgi:hypothetical protein